MNLPETLKRLREFEKEHPTKLQTEIFLDTLRELLNALTEAIALIKERNEQYEKEDYLLEREFLRKWEIK